MLEKPNSRVETTEGRLDELENYPIFRVEGKKRLSNKWTLNSVKVLVDNKEKAKIYVVRVSEEEERDNGTKNVLSNND